MYVRAKKIGLLGNITSEHGSQASIALYLFIFLFNLFRLERKMVIGEFGVFQNLLQTYRIKNYFIIGWKRRPKNSRKKKRKVGLGTFIFTPA